MASDGSKNPSTQNAQFSRRWAAFQATVEGHFPMKPGADCLRSIYLTSNDPWSYRTRWYEARKRTLALAMLPYPRFARAFEPGCGNGELTIGLARRCDRLLATDGVERAAALSKARVADNANVTVACKSMPEEWPRGYFDLIVISDLACHLNPATLADLAERTERSLTGRAVLLLCHWRHPVNGSPLSGDVVHAYFRRRIGLPRQALLEEKDFLLELWGADNRSVAARH